MVQTVALFTAPPATKNTQANLKFWNWDWTILPPLYVHCITGSRTVEVRSRSRLSFFCSLLFLAWSLYVEGDANPVCRHGLRGRPSDGAILFFLCFLKQSRGFPRMNLHTVKCLAVSECSQITPDGWAIECIWAIHCIWWSPRRSPKFYSLISFR